MYHSFLIHSSADVHSKGDQSWDFFGRNDAEAETPVLWPPHGKSWLIGKDSDAGRDWGAGGEGDDRGWDGWIASPTWWMWVWMNSGSWWWTGRPGVLWFMGSQRVGHDWATELNWTEPRVTLKRTVFLIGFMWLHLTRRPTGFVTSRLVKMKVNLSLRTRWSHPL